MENVEKENSKDLTMEKTKKKNSMISGIRDLPKHLNTETISSGIIAGIFSWTTSLILYANAQTIGMTPQETTSWIFACCVFGPLLGMGLSVKYKQPIVGAWSIPGAAVVVSAASAGYSLQQLSAGFLIAGLIVLILGTTGLINRVMKFLPMPIVMGMTAGVLFKFVTNIVDYIHIWIKDGTDPNSYKYLLITALALLTWLLVSKFQEKVKALPAILAAFIVIVVGIFMFKLYDPNSLEGLKFHGPVLIGFSFKNILGIIFSISLPTAALIIGAQNAQAIGVMESQGYEPPIKSMTVWSGIGGLVTSVFGGHGANIAGPMTAITASEEAGENKESRYAGAIVCGIFSLIIGIFASVLVPLLDTMPILLINIIAGLAMIKVILSSLQSAFSAKGRFQISAFFTFAVGISQQSFLGIGSEFWSLLIGTLVALILETEDFKYILSEMKEE